MWYLSGGILVVPVKRRLSPWPGYPFIKLFYYRDGVRRCYQLETLQQNNLPMMYASKHGFETLKLYRRWGRRSCCNTSWRRSC